ncbi:MAG: ABC transporter permease, partial [Pseudomonadota bacterium]
MSEARTGVARLKGVSFRDAGVLIGLIVIFGTFSYLAPSFLTTQNVLNIFQQSSINACIALGMTLVIVSGGIDLSVGPTAALTAVITASLLVWGVPVPIAILAGLCVGMCTGFFNGVLIAYAGLQPFIVTLGGLSLFRALALIYTGGNPIFGIPSEFRAIFNGASLGIPKSVLIVAALALGAWILLNRTPFGEYLMAVGGNGEAAHVAGVPVRRTKIIAYMISGTMASVAALILTGRLGA